MKLKLGATALSMLTFAGCGAQPGVPPPDSTPIEASTALVERVEWPSTFEAGGIVRATHTASVSSRIVAPVVAVHVTAGDTIRRGQALVTLESRELRANVDRAAATLAAARETSAAAAANLEAATAALTLARASHDRIHTLHATRSATPQELDDAIGGLSGATARVTATRAQAAAAAAGWEAAQASTEFARIGLSYAVLTAPFEGVVASRSVDPGSLALPGVELIALESREGRRLEVHIDESRRSQLAVGNGAEVRLQSGGGAAPWIPTRIVEIATVDPRQHSFKVKIDLPPAAGARSGTFGRARLFGPSRQTLAVPSETLVRRGQLWFVFALDSDGTARLRLVTPGEVRGEHVEVLSGAIPGDRLVTDPPPALQDGTRVRVRAQPAVRQAGPGADR